MLEDIALQQARVAVLERRWLVAERAVGRATCAATGTSAHLRADAALTALESAEQALTELLAQHAARSRAVRALVPGGLRLARTAGQDGLFDVG